MEGHKSGSKSKYKHLYRLEVDQLKLTSQREGVFVISVPQNSMIKEILLYRPFTRSETVVVKFHIDDSPKSTFNLRTNKLHTINVRIEGMVFFTVASETIEKIIIFYEL